MAGIRPTSSHPSTSQPSVEGATRGVGAAASESLGEAIAGLKPSQEQIKTHLYTADWKLEQINERRPIIDFILTLKEFSVDPARLEDPTLAADSWERIQLEWQVPIVQAGGDIIDASSRSNNSKSWGIGILSGTKLKLDMPATTTPAPFDDSPEAEEEETMLCDTLEEGMYVEEISTQRLVLENEMTRLRFSAVLSEEGASAAAEAVEIPPFHTELVKHLHPTNEAQTDSRKNAIQALAKARVKGAVFPSITNQHLVGKWVLAAINGSVPADQVNYHWDDSIADQFILHRSFGGGRGMMHDQADSYIEQTSVGSEVKFDDEASIGSRDFYTPKSSDEDWDLIQHFLNDPGPDFDDLEALPDVRNWIVTSHSEGHLLFVDQHSNAMLLTRKEEGKTGKDRQTRDNTARSGKNKKGMKKKH